MLFIKWTKTCIFIVLKTILTEASSPWSHYEESYTGGCISSENSKSCINLGEHAYKGHILNEPPKGSKFYLDDLEPFDEDYLLPFERERRSSKRKGGKNIPHESGDHKVLDIEGEDEDDDDDDDELEKKNQKPNIRGNERKKNKRKKIEKEIEEAEEDEEEGEVNDEESEDGEARGKKEKEVATNDKIKQ